ncbi:MAG: HAMP domain-containing sensor histidine kinase [Anaerosomatales bacterium]|nr:HAMP domain-containing sensor histidine kinase [Anaerosomatales bacterium]MDT8433882.1 HAMP domain-containing sensor histidine kinase [Anaerosomatales bacterium]
MRRSSLRSRLLAISVIFSVLTVGGISLTSYMIVTDSMAAVARDRPVRVAAINARVLNLQASELEQDRGQGGALSAEGERLAVQEFVSQANTIFGERVPAEPQIAILDSNLRPLWQSSDIAVVSGLDDQRRETLRLGEQTASELPRRSFFSGLVGPAVLSIHVAHAPIVLPGGGQGLLEVAYYPFREEAVIDSIRPPMLALAVFAMLVMTVMMQTSMNWVLRLVDDLRSAADSVDAGRLDVRLPTGGDHEIGELARSINRLIDRLRQRAEMQSRFVADASHELATPVAGIRGYTSILRAWGGEDPEVRGEAIAAIDRESRRMARLCGNLLSLVRSDQVVHVKSVQFDANAVAREALAAAATHHHEKGLDVVGPEEGQLFMTSDPDRVEDILSVLLDNACKYTPEGGRVELSTRREQEWVVFEISDTGVGIPPEDLDNVFERFYRSDASRTEATGGFGLGLAIAKTTVDVLHGSIKVRSLVDEGSVFTVRIPRG